MSPRPKADLHLPSSTRPGRWLPVLVLLPMLVLGCNVSEQSPSAPETASLEELLAGAAAPAPCTERSTRDPHLCQPREIHAPAGSDIDTCFRIEMRDWCKADVAGVEGRKVLVPYSDPACRERDRLSLRTYGIPARGGSDCSSSEPDLYHWSTPAPTMRILHPRAQGANGRGQGFGIHLVNAMPKISNECKGDEQPPNCFHGDNTTNLHFHGFRVSPQSPQDYVFLKLKPGEDFRYQVDPITELQPVGTQWYHPHKHGSTAIQVANGMAGAFAVVGYLDDAIRRQFPTIRERILVVQQIFPNLDYFPKPGEDGRPDRPDRSLWVNGMQKPVVTLFAGEIQRWRMVAAMQQTSSQFLLDFPIAARQIAQDGLPFTPRQYADQPLDLAGPAALFEVRRQFAFEHLELAARTTERAGILPRFHFAAGNRIDVLVRAPRTENWPRRCRSEDGSPRKWCEFGAMYTQFQPLHEEALEDFTPVGELVTLRVLNARFPSLEFPEIPKRPAYLRLEDVTKEEIDGNEKLVVFSADKGPGSNPAQPNFCIDGRKYDPDAINHCLALGTAAEWRLENRAPEGQGLIAHPFHIHTNPFQLYAVNDEERKPKIWFDTFPLPTQDGTPPSVTIRHRFLRFDGQYVLHCHILGHEDRGMMQNVESYAAGTICEELAPKYCDTCPCP